MNLNIGNLRDPNREERTRTEAERSSELQKNPIVFALYQQLPAVILGLVSDPLINQLPVETTF